ncbi:MAG: hypothetical protein ACR2PX_18285 [Endozoicomonas sp.]
MSLSSRLNQVNAHYALKQEGVEVYGIKKGERTEMIPVSTVEQLNYFSRYIFKPSKG